MKEYDNRPVRITTVDEKIYEGICTHNSCDYCFHEFGRDEESLEIDDYLFFADEIRNIELIQEEDIHIWDSLPQHMMKLDPDAYTKIESGTKTIEMRLYDEKRQNIRKGDIIRFEMTDSSEDVMRAEVIDLFVFDSFEQLYESLPLSECGYSEEELNNARPEDMNRYYSQEKRSMYKAVGIQIKVI